MNQEPLVYIILLNYKRYQQTIDCIKSIYTSSYTNFRIIIIDNDSQNNSLNQIRNFLDENKNIVFDPKIYYEKEVLRKITKPVSGSKITLIQSENNGGYAAGNNIGLKLFINDPESDYVFIINPDVELSKETIWNLVETAEVNNKKRIYGCVSYLFNNKEEKKLFLYGGFLYSRIRMKVHAVKTKKNNVDFLSGAYMFMPKEILKKDNLIPECYFLYWEEAAFCTELKLQGVELVVNENAVVYDKANSLNTENEDLLYYYFLNGLRFYYRYQIYIFPLILFNQFLLMIFYQFRNKTKSKLIYKSIRTFFTKHMNNKGLGSKLGEK